MGHIYYFSKLDFPYQIFRLKILSKTISRDLLSDTGSAYVAFQFSEGFTFFCTLGAILDEFLISLSDLYFGEFSLSIILISYSYSTQTDKTILITRYIKFCANIFTELSIKISYDPLLIFFFHAQQDTAQTFLPS